MADKATDKITTALRAKLNGRGLTMTWFTMGSVPLVEFATQQAGDLAVIDLQHGLWSRMDVHHAARVASVPIMVRTAGDNAVAIGAALDSGAAGILVPSVETADQARAIVRAARYPPHGHRSGGGVHPLGTGFERYLAHFNEPLIGLMIESLEGVSHATEIAAVPGVDFLFAGTGDLSLSIGCFPKVDGRFEEACRQILEACRAAGKPCGIFTGSAEAARLRLDEGYRAAVIADDIFVVKAGFLGAGKALARRAR
jgi:2-dehydro-3-deoxyglucarate aldolase/4-hydroxy-2-oxoheptanedioate aldolase